MHFLKITTFTSSICEHNSLLTLSVVVATWLYFGCLLGIVFIVVASWPVDMTIWPAIACVFVCVLFVAVQLDCDFVVVASWPVVMATWPAPVCFVVVSVM